MKKRIWAVLLIALMCLTVFAGCGIAKNLERNVYVTVEIEGKTYGPYTVNMFNNAIVPNPEQTDPPLVVEDGMRFVGWTAQQNWNELEQEQVQLTSNLYLIRYNEVKDFADEQGNVTLYPVVRPIILKDLVVAWYDKESTSHLNQEIMDGFERDMREYIASQGYNVDSLDIEVRGYAGTVGTSCGDIRRDGDVDIMVGWAATNNLVNTGGMDAAAILDNQGDIYINPNEGARYTARLNDRELTKLVYQWILDTYQLEIHPTALTLTPTEAEIEIGKAISFTVGVEPTNAKTDVTWTTSDETIATVDGGRVTGVAAGTATITATSAYNSNVKATATVTVVEPAPVTKETLKIAWYAKEGTSGLNAELMATVEQDLNDFLATKGYNADNLEVIFKGYEGNVGPSCAEIMADNDVDIMLGWAANITSTSDSGGKMPQSMIIENVGNVKINSEKARYAALLTDDYISRLAFWWVQKTYVEGFEGVEPLPDGTKLVIGWYSLTDTTGLTADMMTAVKTAFEEHLTSLGYDTTKLQIEVRDIGSGSVAEVGEKVNNDADYDILFGMGGNITSKAGIAVKPGEVEHQYRVDVTMGGKGRNIAWLEMSTSPLTEIMWNWLFGLDGTDAWLSSEAAVTAGFTYSAPQQAN